MKAKRLICLFLSVLMVIGVLNMDYSPVNAASKKKKVEFSVKTVNDGLDLKFTIEEYPGAEYYNIVLCGRENAYSPYLDNKDKDISLIIAKVKADSGKTVYTMNGLTKGKYTFYVEAMEPEDTYYEDNVKSEKKTVTVKAPAISERGEVKYDFSKTKIGEVITFGAYEQDGDLSNGKEPIEWIVLSKDKNEMLVLSKYALDYLPFHVREYYGEDETDKCFTTWASCSIRDFLNNVFYDEAFTKGEKKLVKTNTIKTTVDFEWRKKETKTTKDNVFLLSSKDLTSKSYGFAKERTLEDINRRCSYTAYAILQKEFNRDHRYSGAGISDYRTEDGDEAIEWMLRDLWMEEQFLNIVRENGTITFSNFKEHFKIGYGYAVRPAILIDMSSFKIKEVESVRKDANAENKKKIKINKKNFPYEEFRDYISEEFDKNEDGWLSEKEMNSVENISFSGGYYDYDSISKKNRFKGIELFKNLRTLSITNATIKKIDLSNIKTLEKLTIRINEKNSSIDISGCSNLKELSLTNYGGSYGYYNKNASLKQIKLIGDSSLEKVSIKNVKIKTVNLPESNNIVSLTLSDLQLSELNLGNNTALQSFICNGNNLKVLDVSKNTDLTSLDCSGNKLSELDLSNNTMITDLNCQQNELSKLDLSRNLKLIYLNCSENKLSELDFGTNTVLEELNCSENALSALDLNSSNLNKLDCSLNQLQVLNLKKSGSLKELNCYGNQLSDIDISKNTALMDLNCADNKLTTIDISNNPVLEILDCSYNQIVRLDVSSSKSLTELACMDNSMESIKLCKGLTLLDCSKNQLTDVDVSAIVGLQVLNCSVNKLSSIDVSRNTDLCDLFCRNNELTKLDISKNKNLGVLNCSYNRLKELDLTKNTELTGLDCGYNELTELNTSKNKELSWLYCSGNKIKELDLHNNYIQDGDWENDIVVK
ncbi:MAG: DUF6273 domain-containing protein [Lachnospiraceae bacterium]|nr:DUF6273 domain-containing protein [Lachnospiraceae bacterium]